MAIDKTVKRKVMEDWQKAFPQLTMYAQNKFYKVLGSCILGIELIKSPHKESYSPYFVLYSLWGNRLGNDIKACMAGPILLMDFKNKNGYQFDIPYEKHNAMITDAIECVKKQTPLPFEGDIAYYNILSILDNYSKAPPLSAAPNSYLQALLQETKLNIALFVSARHAQNEFEKISKRNWDGYSFKRWKVELAEWLKNLEESISNRNDFLKKIEINKKEKRIIKLLESNITA